MKIGSIDRPKTEALQLREQNKAREAMQLKEASTLTSVEITSNTYDCDLNLDTMTTTKPMMDL
jgi:hypothetical protein